MRRQISTKGSHGFMIELSCLLAQKLDDGEPTQLAILGLPPKYCGEVIRHMDVKGSFLTSEGDEKHFELFGEISRPARRTGSKAWQRAVITATIGDTSWVVYAKRDESRRLIVDTVWSLA